jgi:hypothetical protein
MSWDEGSILIGQKAGIVRVSANGGEPEVLVKIEPEEIAGTPRMLPGGRAVLFTLSRAVDPDTAEIVVQTLRSGERKTLVRGATTPATCRQAIWYMPWAARCSRVGSIWQAWRLPAALYRLCKASCDRLDFC